MNSRKRKKLVIISHTEHFVDGDQVRGWGPTINEVNYLADYWEEVVHVACLYPEPAPPSALPYTKSNIRFAPIPPYGGKTIQDKILIFAIISIIIPEVYRNIQGASEVQLRLPTAMGLFLLPLFSFFIPRKFTFWVKYAGNWNQKTPPYSYRIQRWFLKKNFPNCKVTINGFWPDQPDHCISFENPCLKNNQINDGKNIIDTKKFNKPYSLIFIGRIEEEKGVIRILEALKKISPNFVQEMIFIGDGPDKEEFAKFSTKEVKVDFLGSKNSNQIHEILKHSDFLLLPSTASEGFPKVIAEAACYGVIPIVSNVGSIPHYLNQTNGYIWDLNGEISFSEFFAEVMNNITPEDLNKKVLNAHQMAQLFTFENYKKKLEEKVFCDS